MTAYEWDESKRKTNLSKHGVDFAVMESFVWEESTVIPDNRKNYGELRFLGEWADWRLPSLRHFLGAGREHPYHHPSESQPQRGGEIWLGN
jgi:uncharacterized DUF497 family protein